MSRQRALDTINLKPVDRLAHTDYSMEYHKDYIAKVTGLPDTDTNRTARFYDAWDFDFLWGTNDGLHANWGARGRATDMGHASYAADGSDQTVIHDSPFKSPEDVWAFDPVAEYGLPDFKAQVSAYQKMTDERRVKFPGQLVTGGYYKTIISGAIQSFGWDMLLMAASEEDKFEKVLDGFFRFTQHHMNAWAETDVEVVIQHDDFVWTAGPFMNPEFYRRVIISRYRKLWEPLHKAGKKVLFCSDGNFTEFAKDIVATAHADGLIFEPMNDFEYMVNNFGGTSCLVGSAVDCRDMTFGKWDKVKADMDRTFMLAEKCKGLIFAVGNHIPANISDDMCDRYIDYFRANCRRREKAA
ncbi:MAG: hypothetical protein HZC28_16665 [Spirochaetes bacterium]|nr:hypothetical protein [Spirochaetota bacterium]